jgi:HEAT repeat protein
MNPVIALLGAAVAFSVIYLFAYEAGRARMRAWRGAAKAAGLADLVAADVLGVATGLTARLGLLRVSFERYQRGRSEKGTRIVIDGLGHPSYEFALRKEGMGSAIEKAFGEREIEIGDREFDRKAYVHGSPRVVHAILDAETRRLVGELIDGRISTEDPGEPLEGRVAVSDGALRAEIPESSFRPGGQRLPGALRTLLAAARRLVLPDDIPARLAHSVRADPLPEVRLANLLTLAREFPAYAATQEALRAACEDSDHEVRLRAALALGDDGREVLLGLASSAEADDRQTARAVSALGEHLAPEQAEQVLGQALRSKRRATARAAVAALGERGGSEVVTALAAALVEEDDELVEAVATALGATGEASAEAPLVAAFDRHGPAVWTAIAAALGRVGTAGAVAPLRTMASRYPFDLGLRRASRQAIAEIQSRLTGATPGQLALADGDAGQLSLAEEDAHGRVSVVSEDEADAETEGAPDLEGQWPADETSGESATAPDEESAVTPSPPPPERPEKA